MFDFVIPVMIEVDSIARLCMIAPAALLDAVFRCWPGFWRSKLHPGSVLDRFLRRADSKLNRRYRSETSRFVRGVLVLAFVLSVAVGVGWAMTGLVAGLPYGWIAMPVLLSHILSVAAGHVRIAEVIKTDTLARGSTAPSHFRDVAGLRRHVIEQAITAQCERGWAILLLWVLWGFPGMCFAFAISCCDGALAKRAISSYPGAFGLPARRIADILYGIAGLLQASVTVIAVAVLGGRYVQAALVALRTAMDRDGSFSVVLSGAVLAGGYDLALGGPGSGMGDAWLGHGRARLTRSDLRRTSWTLLLAWFLAVGAVPILVLWILAG